MMNNKKNKTGFNFQASSFKFQISPFKKLLVLSIGLALFSFVGLPQTARANEASLSIYPQTGSFTIGSTFDVSVFLNTGEKNVNAVKVDLKFDPEKLQVVTPAKGLSAVGVWVFPPSFSNTKGEISLQGGFLGKGINTSQGLISVIVFEAIDIGRTEVNFLDSSQVLIDEVEGINILTSVNRGIYDILLAPSKGPRIFSETHPDQNKWYKNNSPVFSWEKSAEAVGYSYKLDDNPYGEPDNIINTEFNSVSFNNVEDGILYFHLKAKKGNVWGGTSHYRVMIDATPPIKFESYFEPFSLVSENYLFLYFNTVDLLSGIDRYEVRIADFTDSEHVTLSGWIRSESPFRFAIENPGTFKILVRAYDKAGNFQEQDIEIKALGSLFILSTLGLQIKGLFLPQWLIYGIVILTIIFFGVNFYFILKKRNLSERLKKEIKEAEKEIEDVRRLEKKIQETRNLEEEAKKEAERLAQRLRGPEA